MHIPGFLSVPLQIAILVLISDISTSPNSPTTLKSGGYVVATLRTVIRRPRSSILGEPITNWRLFNNCSRGFVQSFLRTVNALGRSEDVCLTYFTVWMRYGTIALQNTRSKRFLCFNNRRRLTTRMNGSSPKCRFREHMNSGGYTLLESAHDPGVYLGFGLQGHSINVVNQWKKRRCLQFTKLDSELSNDSIHQSDCTAASRRAQDRRFDSRDSMRSVTDSELATNFIHRSLLSRILV